MIEFLQAILRPEFEFLRYALIAGFLGSISFGVIGTYVVARRITYLAAAIAHTAIGGIGGALYLKNMFGLEWLDPLYGALVLSIAITPILGWVSLNANEREDTVITALWTFGMGVGLLLIARIPGYVDAMSYLFGDILVLSRMDLIITGILAIFVLVLGIYFYHPLMAICYDAEFARLRGLGQGWLFFLLLILTACVVVLLIRVVGVVMVIALLGIPPALGSYFSHQLWQMMAWGCIICFSFIFFGLYISFAQDLPSGPSIATIGGSVYLLGLLSRTLIRKLITRRRKIEASVSSISDTSQKNCCKK